MLGNPIYKGKFIWNGIEYEGKHEPLVSCSLWYSVQDSCEKRCVEKPKQTAEFAYTGLMKCGNCGCAITAERKKDKYNYYHCTGHKGWHYKEPVVREEKLEAQFSSLLKGLEIEEGIARIILEWLEAETRDERKTLEETRERLAAQRRSLQRRSEVLYDDRLDGRITVTRFDEKDAEIRRELELVEEKLDSLEVSSPVDPLESARGILELSQNAHRLFVKAPADEKKQFLQNMLSNCTLQAGSISPVLRQPFDMLYDTNSVWKASGAVSSNRLFIIKGGTLPVLSYSLFVTQHSSLGGQDARGQYHTRVTGLQDTRICRGQSRAGGVGVHRPGVLSTLPR